MRTLCKTSVAATSPCVRILRAAEHGWSLLELSIVVVILGVVATLAVPQYQNALATSRYTKCKQELKLISIAIDSFKLSYGRLPLTLHEVGYGGRLDPWGAPYCYLNYAAGTGDGLDWALEEGMVDPESLPNSYSMPAPAGESSGEGGTSGSSGSGSSGSSDSGSSGSGSSGSSGSGSSGSSGSGSSGSHGLGGTVTTITSELAGTGATLGSTLSSLTGKGGTGTSEDLETGASASSPIDPYAFGHTRQAGGNAVETVAAPRLEALLDAGIPVDQAETVLGRLTGKELYMDVDVPTVRRRNQYMFPLNTDYDLFSLGPNGMTAAALNNPTALDDVIRANNGGYFGLANDY